MTIQTTVIKAGYCRPDDKGYPCLYHKTLIELPESFNLNDGETVIVTVKTLHPKPFVFNSPNK